MSSFWIFPNIPDEMFAKADSLYTRINSDQTSNVLQKLEWIYAHLDELGVYVKSSVSCSSGCSYCCKMDVQISTLEAAYIQEKTGTKFSDGNSVTTGHSKPCPFLDKSDACSIYRYRPLTCRIYHALGLPEDCKPGHKQIQYGAPPNFGNEIYKNLISWSHHITLDTQTSIRDIRDFFA